TAGGPLFDGPGPHPAPVRVPPPGERVSGDEGPPPNIFDESLAPADPPPKPVLDPQLAAQPTVIFANDGKPVSASGSVIIEPQVAKPINLLDTAPKGAPSISQRVLVPTRGQPTVWKDILIGVGVAAVVLLGAVGVRTLMRGKDSGGRATLVVALMVPRQAEVHVRGADGEHHGKLAQSTPAATFKG